MKVQKKKGMMKIRKRYENFKYLILADRIKCILDFFENAKWAYIRTKKYKVVIIKSTDE